MAEPSTNERRAVLTARAQLETCGREIGAAAQIGNWPCLQALDLRMRELLTALRAQPHLQRECAEQIAALQQQHQLALQSGKQQLLLLSQRVATALRACEQHGAYRMVDQCL